MNKEEIERYKIRDYYMIPVEIVDSIFYSFEQENQKYKEVIDKAIEFLYKIKFDKTDKYICISEYIEYQQLLDILKEVE